MKYVWKVVHGDARTDLTTCSACIWKGPYKLRYKIGKETCARKGTVGIFAFETRQSAVNFALHKLTLRPMSILKCSYKERHKPNTKKHLFYTPHILRHATSFINLVRAVILDRFELMRNLPERTVLVSSLVPESVEAVIFR